MAADDDESLLAKIVRGGSPKAGESKADEQARLRRLVTRQPGEERVHPDNMRHAAHTVSLPPTMQSCGCGRPHPYEHLMTSNPNWRDMTLGQFTTYAEEHGAQPYFGMCMREIAYVMAYAAHMGRERDQAIRALVAAQMVPDGLRMRMAALKAVMGDVATYCTKMAEDNPADRLVTRHLRKLARSWLLLWGGRAATMLVDAITHDDALESAPKPSSADLTPHQR